MEKKFFEFDATKKYFNYDINMLIAKYNNRFYECKVSQNTDYDMILFSDEKITENSIMNDNNTYETFVDFEELQDVISKEIYAVYNGKPFNIGYLYNGFDDIDLLSDNDLTFNYKEAGFTYSDFYNKLYLRVSGDKIEKFLYVPSSIYQLLLHCKENSLTRGKKGR